MDRPLVYNPNIDLNDRSSNFNMSNNQGDGFNNTNFENMQNNLNDMPSNFNNIQNNFSGMQQNRSNFPNTNYSNANYSNTNYSNTNFPNTNYSNYNQPMNMEHFIKKNKKNHFTNTKKCNNLKTFLRKVIVITILYVIISHKKMSLLLCNNVPYTCISKALTYNIFKGIIFGIIVYFTYSYM